MSDAVQGGAGKSFFKALWKQVRRFAFSVNAVAVLWLLACSFISLVPCDEHPYISVISITFPVALLVNLLFVLFWLLVHIRYTLLSLLGILVCWSFVRDYCPINLGGEPSEKCLKVVSWNTMGMGKTEDREEAKEYVKNLDADIICLQEAGITGGGWDDFIQEMKDKGYEHHCQKGLTLFTRLHLVDTDTISYDTRTNGSRWYRLAGEEDTIWVVNNHLESNHLSMELREEYGQVIDKPVYQKAKESGHSILSHMVQSARYRGGQARELCNFVDEHQGERVIVCGDFNDTPVSYAYQAVRRRSCVPGREGGTRMKNAFREGGRGMAFSYNGKGFWVRIDHIFFSPEGECHKACIDRSIGISDHYPIISWLDF